MLGVIYAVTFMLSFENKPLMCRVDMLNAVILSVVALPGLILSHYTSPKTLPATNTLAYFTVESTTKKINVDVRGQCYKTFYRRKL